jgi:hypothetical protein
VFDADAGCGTVIEDEHLRADLLKPPDIGVVGDAELPCAVHGRIDRRDF